MYLLTKFRGLKSPGAARQPPMDKSNMAENPEKQTAWMVDQYPPMILNPNLESKRTSSIGSENNVLLVYSGIYIKKIKNKTSYRGAPLLIFPISYPH